MYKLLKRDGNAKRGEFHTVHGVIQTPVFMNVGTAAAIKGAVSSIDLKGIGTQVELCNTYHLHVRPGDEVVKKMGGLHKFMNWDRPMLTDSGGFQVFSLAGLRKIKEEGVYFHSHIDGRKIFMGPEESMRIQSNLASTIAMAFDECPPHPATREYMQNSVDRTTRWLVRCKAELDRLKWSAGYDQPSPDAVWYQPGWHLCGYPDRACQTDLRTGSGRLCAGRPGGRRDPRGDVPSILDEDGALPAAGEAGVPDGRGNACQHSGDLWSGAWTSSTASIPAGTAVTAMYTPTTAS